MKKTLKEDAADQNKKLVEDTKNVTIKGNPSPAMNSERAGKSSSLPEVGKQIAPAAPVGATASDIYMSPHPRDPEFSYGDDLSRRVKGSSQLIQPPRISTKVLPISTSHGPKAEVRLASPKSGKKIQKISKANSRSKALISAHKANHPTSKVPSSRSPKSTHRSHSPQPKVHSSAKVPPAMKSQEKQDLFPIPSDSAPSPPVSSGAPRGFNVQEVSPSQREESKKTAKSPTKKQLESPKSKQQKMKNAEPGQGQPYDVTCKFQGKKKGKKQPKGVGTEDFIEYLLDSKHKIKKRQLKKEYRETYEGAYRTYRFEEGHIVKTEQLGRTRRRNSLDIEYYLYEDAEKGESRKRFIGMTEEEVNRKIIDKTVQQLKDEMSSLEDTLSSADEYIPLTTYNTWQTNVSNFLDHPNVSTLASIYCVFITIFHVSANFIVDFIPMNSVVDDWSRLIDVIMFLLLLESLARLIFSERRFMWGEILNVYDVVVQSYYIVMRFVLKSPIKGTYLMIMPSLRLYRCLNILKVFNMDKDIYLLKFVLKHSFNTLCFIYILYILVCTSLSICLFVTDLMTETQLDTAPKCFYYAVSVLSTASLGDIDAKGTSLILTVMFSLLIPLFIAFPTAIFSHYYQEFKNGEKFHDKKMEKLKLFHKKPWVTFDSIDQTGGQEILTFFRKEMLEDLQKYKNYLIWRRDLTMAQRVEKLKKMKYLIEMRGLYKSIMMGEFDEMSSTYTRHMQGYRLPKIGDSLTHKDFGRYTFGSIRRYMYLLITQRNTTIGKIIYTLSLVFALISFLFHFSRSVEVLVQYNRRPYFCVFCWDIDPNSTKPGASFMVITNADVLIQIYFAWFFCVRMTLSPSLKDFLLDMNNVIDALTFMPVIVGIIVKQKEYLDPQLFTGISRVSYFLMSMRLLKLIYFLRESSSLSTLIKSIANSAYELTSYYRVLVVVGSFFGLIIFHFEQKHPKNMLRSETVMLVWTVTELLNAGIGTVRTYTSTGLYILGISQLVAIFMLGFPIGIFMKQFLQLYNFNRFHLRMRHRHRIARYQLVSEYIHMEGVPLTDAIRVNFEYWHKLLVASQSTAAEVTEDYVKYVKDPPRLRWTTEQK